MSGLGSICVYCGSSSGADERFGAAADALDALLAASEVEATPPPETPPAEDAVLARIEALENENKTLKAGLDKALASRQSQETVMGDTPFKSRYGGAFIR